MSFNLEQVRKIYSDPIIGKIAAFSKAIAKLQSDNVEIESDDKTGFGDSDHTKVTYTDYWNFARSFASQHHFVTFDGIDDRISLGNQGTLWSQPLGKFSYSFWILPTTGWDGQTRLVTEHGSGPAHSFYCDIDNANVGQIRFHVENAASSNFQAESTSLVLNQWNHITCVYDNSLVSGNLKIYVNGIVGSVTANLTENVNTSNTFYLGFNSNDFKGRMRDFRWWTTTALTQEEIIKVKDNLSTAPIPNYWLPLKAVDSGNPIDVISGTLQGSLENGALFPDRAEIKVPFEPDFNKLRLDYRFSNLGGTIEDYSTFKNHGTIYGEPCPATGSEVFYRGGSKKNVGWSVPQEDQIYITVSNDPAFQMINQMSWVFRLNFRSLEDQDPISGVFRSQTLCEKYDSATDKYFIRVGDEGQVKAGFLDGGVETRVRTTNSCIFPDTDHLIVITYDSGTDAVVFYVDGVVQAQTSTSETFDSATNTSLHLLAATTTGTPNKGYCDLNYIDMLRYYDDMVLSQTQVNNLIKNKFTISNIEEGEVAITDASVIGKVGEGISFTDTSFTDVSFTAG